MEHSTRLTLENGLRVKHNLVLNETLDIKKGVCIDKYSRLTINGDVCISGDVIISNESCLVVTGLMIVKGCMYVTDKAKLIVNKDLLVKGDLDIHDNSVVNLNVTHVSGDTNIRRNSQVTITGNFYTKGLMIKRAQTFIAQEKLTVNLGMQIHDSIVTVKNDLVTNGSLYLGKNSNLFVTANVRLDKGMTILNKSNVLIEKNLAIKGKFRCHGKTNLNVHGEMTLDSDMTLDGCHLSVNSLLTESDITVMCDGKLTVNSDLLLRKSLELRDPSSIHIHGSLEVLEILARSNTVIETTKSAKINTMNTYKSSSVRVSGSMQVDSLINFGDILVTNDIHSSNDIINSGQIQAKSMDVQCELNTKGSLIILKHLTVNGAFHASKLVDIRGNLITSELNNFGKLNVGSNLEIKNKQYAELTNQGEINVLGNVLVKGLVRVCRESTMKIRGNLGVESIKSSLGYIACEPNSCIIVNGNTRINDSLTVHKYSCMTIDGDLLVKKLIWLCQYSDLEIKGECLASDLLITDSRLTVNDSVIISQDLQIQGKAGLCVNNSLSVTGDTEINTSIKDPDECSRLTNKVNDFQLIEGTNESSIASAKLIVTKNIILAGKVSLENATIECSNLYLRNDIDPIEIFGRKSIIGSKIMDMLL